MPSVVGCKAVTSVVASIFEAVRASANSGSKQSRMHARSGANIDAAIHRPTRCVHAKFETVTRRDCMQLYTLHDREGPKRVRSFDV